MLQVSTNAWVSANSETALIRSDLKISMSPYQKKRPSTCMKDDDADKEIDKFQEDIEQY